MIGYTYKTTQKPDGSRTLEAHCGHIHYKDSGLFVPVDYALRDGGEFWEMERASYRLYVNKDFSKPKLIYFQNRFEGANHAITYEPYALAWIHKTNREDIRVFATQQPIIGCLEGNRITWKNAFGLGLDFEVVIQRSGVRKQLVVRNKAALGTPPDGNYVLGVLFKYTGDGLSIRNADDTEWNQNDFVMMNESRRFSVGENALHKSFIQPACVFSGLDYEEPIRVAWKKHNNSLFQIKLVPLATLNSARYPLAIDTVTNFYVGAGDGFCTHNSSSVWATTRGATDSTTVNYTNTTTWINNRQNPAPYYAIVRSFHPIDTSALPDNCIISQATFYARYYNTGLEDPDSYAYVSIVGATQASTSELVNADYDQVGTTEYHHTNYRIYLAEVPTTWVSWLFDSTGIAAISKTGYTKLAQRGGWDLQNVAPNDNTYNFLVVESSEAAVYDPYLEIAYHLPGPHHYYRRQLSL